MAEALGTVWTLEWLLPAVNTDVLFQMMLKLECLSTFWTFELA
jgi:hypothetical protein